MTNTAVAGTILFMLFISVVVGPQLINMAKANPISVPTVPSILVGISSPTFGDGFVNSSVQFRVYVYLQVDSPDLSSISYGLDGAELVDLEKLNVADSKDFGISANGSAKIAFKTYTADISLEGLSEGKHALVAYGNGMSDMTDFTVNSYYHKTALHVFSPGNQVYSDSVPLTFAYTGNITSAHYYIYSGRQLVSDSVLNGNTTIDGLADGSYDLYVFVSTQFGQDSQQIHFTVGNFSEYLFIGVSVTALVALSIGSLVYFKKFRKENRSLTPV
jgi:hypothetical protein